MLLTVSIAILLFGLAISSPYIVYCQLAINPTLRITFCTIVNPTLVQFYVSVILFYSIKCFETFHSLQTYFQVSVINTTLPVVLMALFGFLTIRNIRTVKQTSNHLERQMTRVVAFQTILNATTLLPYCIQTL